MSNEGSRSRSRRSPDLSRFSEEREGTVDSDDEPKLIELQRYDFVVQFCWIPTTKEERQETARLRAEAEAQRAAEAAAAEEESL